jgi:CRISPR-associated protein Csm1
MLTNGLRDERSAARTATLSESLTLFFGGWLDQICAAEPFTNKVYVLYAGGDDLLIIGAWHVIPLLAARIAHDFHLYTGKNPSVHLSAGISIVGAKEPLYAAVEAANKALKKAKQYPTPYNAAKNAINFLDKVVDWSDFQEVQQWRAQLAALVANGAPKSLLLTLLQIYGQYEDDHKSRENSTSGYATRAKMGVYEKRSLYLGPWLWQMIYRLHRLSNEVLTREKIQEIQTVLLQTQRENRAGGVEKIALSARWTQLMARKE